ncbi:MAG: NYN domain-containing protein [Calditrichia bacterium]
MARKTIIIDGYNVIKSPDIPFPQSGDLEEQREHLIRMLRSNPMVRETKMIVVFDGFTPTVSPVDTGHKNISVQFSGMKKSADDIIREKIRRFPKPSLLEVVTSDRDIQFTARSHGVKVVPVAEFWQKLHGGTQSFPKPQSEPIQKESGLSDREVQEWLALFKKKK